MQPLRVSPAQPAWHRQGSKAAGRRRTRALLLESLRGVATRTAEISGVLARTTGATRPEKRAESRDPRPPHRSPRSCCAAVNAAISLAPPAERTTHTPTHREKGGSGSAAPVNSGRLHPVMPPDVDVPVARCACGNLHPRSARVCIGGGGVQVPRGGCRIDRTLVHAALICRVNRKAAELD